VTNGDLIQLNQYSSYSHPVDMLPPGFENIRVWVASGPVVALFNLAEAPTSIQAAWEQLGLPAGTHASRNLLNGQTVAASADIKLTLPAHGSAVYRVDAGGGDRRLR
jgi:hypothetical protein